MIVTQTIYTVGGTKFDPVTISKDDEGDYRIEQSTGGDVILMGKDDIEEFRIALDQLLKEEK